MESYILRVYRREGEGGGALVGTVEDAGGGDKGAFQDVRGLLRLIGVVAREYSPVAGPAEDRRRSGRLPLRIPVTVWGTDAGGRRIDVKATLGDVSAEGARILLGRTVEVGSALCLLVHPIETGLELSGRVVWRGDDGCAGVVFEKTAGPSAIDSGKP